MRPLTPLAVLCLLASMAACDPLQPEAPVEDPACGAAPASFDPAGDVVYASGIPGCVRIERRAQGDGSFVPVRLVAHLDGFSGRIDVDTTALTYEGAPDGTARLTSDELTANIVVDPCTGEWNVDMNDGEVILPVAR